MKNAFIATVMTIAALFISPQDCNASKRCENPEVKSRRGFGLYLGVTRYHHRGNVVLPSRSRGHGIGLGIRYGIFRSRNLGLGIHIR